MTQLRSNNATALLARGEPMVWMAGGGLVVALLMVAGLVGLVFYQGVTTFWPDDVLRIQTRDGQVVVGEVTRSDSYRPEPDLGSNLSGAAYQAFTQEMQRTTAGWNAGWCAPATSS